MTSETNPPSQPSLPESTSTPPPLSIQERLSVLHNPELLKDMSPADLLKFVQETRKQAYSPQTLTAQLNTDSAKLAGKAPRAKSAAAVARQSLLDSL